MITVFAGEAVRVVNTFFNFDNTPQDPHLARFKVYDNKYGVLLDTVLSDSHKVSTGKYFYDYITPTQPNQQYIVEFYGEIAGNPTIVREKIYTTFLKQA